MQPAGPFRRSARRTKKIGSVMHNRIVALLHSVVTRLPRTAKQYIIVALDVLLLPVALFLALALDQDRFPPRGSLVEAWPAVLMLMAIAGLVSVVMGINRIQLKAYEIKALGKTALHAAIMGGAVGVLDMLTGGSGPVTAGVTFGFVYLALAAMSRFALLRLLYTVYRQGNQQVRVMIYGAGRTGQQLVAALSTDDSIVPVAFVDDNQGLQSAIVQGLRVYSPVAIPALMRERQVQRVVLAMPSQSRSRQAQIIHKLEDMGLSVGALPSFAHMAGDARPLIEQLTPLPAGRFLGRPTLETELPGGAEHYAGRSILVSGAGGSIGSELCRQVIACRPARLVMFEMNELALYTIEHELEALAQRHGVKLVPALGSVRDAPVIRDALKSNGVELVLHAAAYKHVPIVERDPVSGFGNNVIGTQIIAQASAETGVAQFILISTDKAVRPRNMMGASKRLAEIVVQDLASRSDVAAGGTIFSMVRFGNVIGSSGSVIPLFQEQIDQGGPVTLTHRDVERYFMTIPEAARLVLVSASFARGGELFVLDMGDPVRIHTLARNMIEAAGFTVKDGRNPGGDIEITMTGLRPGEKITEELLIGDAQTTTPHPKIMQARERHPSEIEVAACLRDLRQALEVADADALRTIARTWIEGAKTPDRGADTRIGAGPGPSA